MRLVSELLGMPGTADAELFAVTGYARRKVRADALESGFQGLFAKPVELDALGAELAAAAVRR